MRDSGTQADRLYLMPAHIGVDADGAQSVFPGFEQGNIAGRIPLLPVNLYDLGVEAGEAHGGRGGVRYRLVCWSSSQAPLPCQCATANVS